MFRPLARFPQSLRYRTTHLIPRVAQHRFTSTSTQNEDSADDDKNIYRSPAVQVPSLTRLREIANRNGLDINVDDLNHYRDFIENAICRGMDVVDSFPEPTLPVKYPRTPGYRPAQDENTFNGWYWRCDIKGADTGILQGKTIAIKDSIPVAGVPMMNGSYVLEGYVPDYDATVVTKVLDAGGQITGKSSCEDLCYSGAGYIRGKGAVRNPHNMNHSPGGSSNGSAALVAAGHVDMALGGDQGGSIRMPASWCGVVGLKPTFGLVPYTGISQVELTIEHAGPIANNVYDCALLLEAIAGLDGGLDPRQPVNLTVQEYTKGFSMKLPGIKIGILKEGFMHANTEPDVATMVKKSAFQMITLGAKVEEVSIPMHLQAGPIFGGIAVQGSYDMMMKGNGIGSQYNGFYPTNMADALHRGFKTRINDMSHMLKATLLAGEYLKEDYGGRFYGKCQNIRRIITKAYDDAFEKYDVIILPTIPFKAPKLPSQDANLKANDIINQALNMTDNTLPMNLTGHPALTINTGYSNGLPVGMMIVGRRFDDDTVLKVAYAFEKLRDKIESA